MMDYIWQYIVIVIMLYLILCTGWLMLSVLMLPCHWLYCRITGNKAYRFLEIWTDIGEAIFFRLKKKE